MSKWQFAIEYHREKNCGISHCSKTSRKKFLFSFVSPIPFLHEVFPNGINRYRAGAKVWRWALEIKGQASGFRENLHTVG